MVIILKDIWNQDYHQNFQDVVSCAELVQDQIHHNVIPVMMDSIKKQLKVVHGVNYLVLMELCVIQN